MRKLIWIPFVAVGVAIVLAQTSPGQLLQSFGKSLIEAKSLKATYTVMTSGGAPDTFDVALAKPNLARIETPWSLIVADGKTLTVYDKDTKTYSKDPQTDAAFTQLFRDEALLLWSPFFDAKAFDKVTAKSLGTKSRKGTQFQVVEAGFNGGQRTVIYYLDGSNLARQAEITYRDNKGQKTILDAKNLELGSEANGSLFAFNAPTGARELTAEERNSGKWFENLDEGLAEARKTNKLVMIDFGAVW